MREHRLRHDRLLDAGTAHIDFTQTIRGLFPAVRHRSGRWITTLRGERVLEAVRESSHREIHDG